MDLWIKIELADLSVVIRVFAHVASPYQCPFTAIIKLAIR